MSIVVTSRNDDHGGNLLHRMGLFVKSLAGLNAELIVVEWNPPPGQPTLVEALDWPPLGPLQVRIVEVPATYHNRLRNSEMPLFQMIAKNVGIRRARGDWILATNPDLIFPPGLTRFLDKGTFDRHCFYRATRHDLALEYLPNTDVDTLIRLCERNVSQVHRPTCEPHTNACGDFTLAHRSVWEKMGGYLEYELWSPHIDSLLLHMVYQAGYKEVILQWPIYHPKHAKSWAVEPREIYPMLDYHVDVLPIIGAMSRNNLPFIRNPGGWGLHGVKLPETSPRQPALRKRKRRMRIKGWTFFTVPRAFEGSVGVQQENAIRSWLNLHPVPEVLLVGDEPGLGKVAERLGCIHVPDVECNAQGTPYVNDVFGLAQSYASNDLLCYVNTDIVLPPSFSLAALTVLEGFPKKPVVMTGLRWDLDWSEPIDFDKDDWAARLMGKAATEGKFHELTGADYFLFRRGTYLLMPDFLIGRTAWDNWLILDPVRRGIPVVDATAIVMAIHQNHPQTAHSKPAEIRHNLGLWMQEDPQSIEGSIESTSWYLSGGGSLCTRQSFPDAIR